MSEMQLPLVFDLTPMTRKADEGRRIVVSGFDVSKRTFLIASLSMVPAAVLIALLFPFVQMWALAAIPVCEAIGFWLIEGRSSQGMKLRNWQTLIDKRKGRSGQFFICGHPIDVMHSDITIIRSASTPVRRNEPNSDDMFGLGDEQ